MKSRILSLFLVLVVAPACIAGDFVQKVERPAAGQPVGAVELIYSDQSPGAVIHGIAWKGASESLDKRVTMVTDPSEFAARLSAEPWSRVMVTVRYAPGEPSYAQALRDYLSQDRDNQVQMLVWHDNGTQPAADTAVAATRAIVLWNHGTTTTLYSGHASRNPETHEPRTSQGYQYPDFQGIDVEDPTFQFRVPVGAAGIDSSDFGANRAAADPVSCEMQCVQAYIGEVAVCIRNHNTQLAQCQALYGPSEGDPGDPAAYATCTANANNTNTACITGAGQRFDNCMLLCDELSP